MYKDSHYRGKDMPYTCINPGGVIVNTVIYMNVKG